MRTVLIGLTGILLLIFLLWKVQLGMARFFDADEFAYLHWAHNVFVGRIPYIDFLLYVPPGFLWMLAPLFTLVGGTAILTAGRVFAFVVFCGLVLAIMVLFWQVRKSWIALLAGAFLAFLPIPSDKFLEIRPDSVAMLFVLLGMIAHISAFNQSAEYKFSGLIQGKRLMVHWRWLWAGVWYGASLLVLPKMVPHVAVATAMVFVWGVLEDRGNAHMRKFRNAAWAAFTAGLAAPFVGFVVWMVGTAHSWGDVGVIVYSLTKLPFEVNRLGNLFPMQPDLFFYPNSTYYGAFGISSGFIANHAVWLIGLITGSIRLMTPFLPHGKRGAWSEVLISGSFLVHIAAFMYGYPMRHEQYLVPISIFVAFYAADAVDIVWRCASRRVLGRVMFVGAYCVALVFMCRVAKVMYNAKMMHTNGGDRQTLAYALATIPNGSYVLDLVGSTIYYQDPYYVSAVPFGQWEPYLSRPLPSLADALERTLTKYVYQGKLQRVDGLSEKDRAYIQTHFVPDIGSEFFKRK